MTSAVTSFGEVSDWLGPVESAGVLNGLRRCHDARMGSAFRSVRDTLLSSAPDLASASGFTPAVEILAGIRWSSVQPVLSHPSFEKWLNGALGFLARGSHLKLPHGQIVSHLGSVASFALAALLRQGQHGSVEVPVDAHGRVHVRGLGRMLQLPVESAGLRVRCTTGPDGVVGVDERTSARTDELPRTATGWELNWADPILSSDNPFPVDADGSMLSELSHAWELVRNVTPKYADEIADTMRVVVPIANDAHSEHRWPCMGLWEAQQGRSAHDIAIALLVRSQQAKVRLVLAESVEPAVRGREHWPRVEQLLMDAVAAHTSAAYWSACPQPPNGESGHHAARARRRLADVSAELGEQRSTPPLVEQMRTYWQDDLGGPTHGAGPTHRMDAAPQDVAARPPAVPAPAGDGQVERFVSTWLAAGGQRRNPSHLDQLLVLPSLRVIADLVGISAGIPVNVAFSGVDRADPTLDRLGLERVRNPDRFRNVRRQFDVPITGDPLERMLRGHLDYVDGNIDLAAGHYAVAAMAVPHNLDLWHDLSFALLHLDRPEARVFFFAPDLFVSLADRVRIDHDVAATVLGERRSDDVDDVSAVLAFMRAVDRVLDLEVL